MKATVLVLAVILGCTTLAAPAMGGIIVGLPADGGNCFPFGWYSGEYQQVYSQTQFSAPITITNLEFFNTQNDAGATAIRSGNWVISLSTTSANWDTLESTFANNLGADNTLVFSGNLTRPWAFGDTLRINLSTPFTYDPANGNLLMAVVVTGVVLDDSIIYFDSNNNNTYLGRVFNEGTVNNGYGLVTGFNASGSTTPEPSSLILFGSGVLGFAQIIRRKVG